MKRAALAALSLLLVSTNAFAGKEERDYMKNKMTPAMQEAEAVFKKSCGCAVKITVSDSTTKTTDDMTQAKYIAGRVVEGAPAYCNDDESKKAICKMKSLEIGKTPEAAFTFKGDKGVATHDGNAGTTWEMMTQQLDK